MRIDQAPFFSALHALAVDDLRWGCFRSPRSGTPISACECHRACRLSSTSRDSRTVPRGAGLSGSPATGIRAQNIHIPFITSARHVALVAAAPARSLARRRPFSSVRSSVSQFAAVVAPAVLRVTSVTLLNSHPLESQTTYRFIFPLPARASRDRGLAGRQLERRLGRRIPRMLLLRLGAGEARNQDQRDRHDADRQKSSRIHFHFHAFEFPVAVNTVCCNPACCTTASWHFVGKGSPGVDVPASVPAAAVNAARTEVVICRQPRLIRNNRRRAPETPRLASRFRSSHPNAARSLASFGFKGTLAIYDSSGPILTFASASAASFCEC